MQALRTGLTWYEGILFAYYWPAIQSPQDKAPLDSAMLTTGAAESWLPLNRGQQLFALESVVAGFASLRSGAKGGLELGHITAFGSGGQLGGFAQHFFSVFL